MGRPVTLAEYVGLDASPFSSEFAFHHPHSQCKPLWIPEQINNNALNLPHIWHQVALGEAHSLQWAFIYHSLRSSIFRGSKASIRSTGRWSSHCWPVHLTITTTGHIWTVAIPSADLVSIADLTEDSRSVYNCRPLPFRCQLIILWPFPPLPIMVRSPFYSLGNSHIHSMMCLLVYVNTT